MDPEALKAYVKTARSGGLTDEAIQQALLAQGLSLGSAQKLLEIIDVEVTDGGGEQHAPLEALTIESAEHHVDAPGGVHEQEPHPKDEALPFIGAQKKQRKPMNPMLKKIEIGILVLLGLVVAGSVAGFVLFRRAPDALAKEALRKFLSLDSYTVTEESQFTFSFGKDDDTAAIPHLQLPGMLSASLLSRIAPQSTLVLGVFAVQGEELGLADAPKGQYTFTMATDSVSDIIPVFETGEDAVTSFADFIVPSQEFAYFRSEGSFASGLAFGEGTTIFVDSAGAMRITEAGDFFVRIDDLTSKVDTQERETYDVFTPKLRNAISQVSGNWYAYDISEFLDEMFNAQRESISQYTDEEEEELMNLIEAALEFESQGVERIDGDFTQKVSVHIDPDGAVKLVERGAQIQRRITCEQQAEMFKEFYSEGDIEAMGCTVPDPTTDDVVWPIVESAVRDLAADIEMTIWVGMLDRVARRTELRVPFSFTFQGFTISGLVDQKSTYSNINKISGIAAPVASEPIENAFTTVEKVLEGSDFDALITADAMNAIEEAMDSIDLFGTKDTLRSARNATRLSDLSSLRSTVGLYAQEHPDGLFPSTNGMLERLEDVCDRVLDSNIFVSGVPLNRCPTDPSGPPAFYGYKSDGESYFEFTTALEDPECAWFTDIGQEGKSLGEDLCLYTLVGGEF